MDLTLRQGNDKTRILVTKVRRRQVNNTFSSSCEGVFVPKVDSGESINVKLLFTLYG